eukprot:scaffold7405_cov18-Tisochrysis_lutea.AAC.1
MQATSRPNCWTSSSSSSQRELTLAGACEDERSARGGTLQRQHSVLHNITTKTAAVSHMAKQEVWLPGFL